MSAALTAAAFKREERAVRVNGTEGQMRGPVQSWTFYLESGVSRFLPLAGSFRRLVFTEPQMVRSSPALQLVMLSRNAVSMKAYRVEGMTTGDRLATDDLEKQFQPAGRGLDMLEIELSEGDRAVLAGVVKEISAGSVLAPAEFSRKATIWLTKRHSYSLKSELPKGESDPLVRWLASSEPGHCELFAGALTLLARTAGHPARVVAGFMGGAWNDDYLIVRNSDAHAWCEIYEGHGNWLRMDPTNDGQRLITDGATASVARANVRTVQRGWAARFDRLRILWYRRIVNFDRADQQDLVRSIKAVAESSTQSLRAWTMQWAGVFRSWVAQPWDMRRWGGVAGLGVLLVTLGYGCWSFGRGVWARWCRARGKDIDPVRKKAGSWLRRLDQVSLTDDDPGVRDSLRRLRYGRRETWPEPERIFARARQLVRKR